MNHCSECFARLDRCQECMDAELDAKNKEIEALKVNNRNLAATRFELMNRVSELEFCLRDVVMNSKNCTQCSASFIAKRKLEDI